MKVERPRARSSAAPTRLKSWSTMPISAASAGTKDADLREERDQRVLPQVGRLAGHVRAGDQPERPRAGAVGAELAVVGDEAAAGAPQRLPRPPDAGRRRCGRRGPRRSPAAPSRSPRGEIGERRRRRRSRRAPRPVAPIGPAALEDRARAARSKIALLDRRARGSPAFRICVSISASASVVKRIALAVVCRCTKSSASGGFSIRSACVGRGLDEVAEHVVVADLQRADAAPPHVLAPAARRSRPRPSSRSRRVSSSSASKPAATNPPSRARSGGSATSAAAEQRRPAPRARPSAAARRGEHLGQLVAERRAQPLRLRQPVAQRREIARAAAVERQPRQRALEVRHPAQLLAHRRARRRPRRGSAPPRPGARATSRTSVDGAVQPRLEQPRAAAGHACGRWRRAASPRARRRGCASARGCAGSRASICIGPPAPSRTGGRSSGSRPRWVSSR